MDSAKNDLVNVITNKLVESNLALFVGAGLSIQAGLPSWRELLRPMANDIGMDIDKETDLISVAQYFVNENAQMKTLLSDHISRELQQQAKPSNNLSILARLPIKTYWTTNYDTLIESALEDARKHPRAVYSLDQLAMTKQGSDATVYKMHGDVNNPKTIVITRDDYEHYNSERALMLNMLSTDLLKNTFLFLGFSFTDPNFNYVASQLRVSLKDSIRPHYWIEARIKQHDGETESSYEYRKNRQKLHINDLKRFGVQCYLVDQYQDLEDVLLQCENSYRRISSRPSTAESVIAPDEVISVSDDRTESRIVVKAPRDGTFYESEGNDNVPLVSVGDLVEVNQALCLLEFEKRFVVLRTRHSGYIEAVMPRDSARVTKNQELFTISPQNISTANPLYYQKTGMGGNFYRASAPDDQPFVREGHIVTKGDDLAIIENMKNYQSVTAEVSGVVVKVIARNGTTLSEGDTMFIIDPFTPPSVSRKQFRVQKSKLAGRFFPNRTLLRQSHPNGAGGTSIHRGELIGQLQQVTKTIDINSEFNGEIREYLIRPGEQVDIDQPLLSIYPTVVGKAYRVQLAPSNGVFQSLVTRGEGVEVGDTIAKIESLNSEVEIKAIHSGSISEIGPTDGAQVRRDTLLFKYDSH